MYCHLKFNTDKTNSKCCPLQYFFIKYKSRCNSVFVTFTAIFRILNSPFVHYKVNIKPYIQSYYVFLCDNLSKLEYILMPLAYIHSTT